MAPVYRWLHLSDLHFGCKGQALYEAVIESFERSLDQWLGKVGGPPDLLLLTGDLANFGKTGGDRW
jgi:3',5'-cyclic AMP phosphodiesterase CpdA